MGEAALAPGTPPAGPRRRWRRYVALIAGATVLTGLLQTVQATGSQARTPTGSHSATVTLTSISPQVPGKGDTVTVTGTVTNNTKSAVAGAHMGLLVAPGGPIDARSTMKSAADRSSYFSTLDGDEVPGHTAAVPTLAPGMSTPFTLKVPVNALNLGTTGVYQIAPALEGQTAAEAWPHVLGLKRTFLPWYAQGETAKPTRISYLWPLVDRPHMAATGDNDSQQSPLFLDDGLTAELKPGGRLWTMLDLAKSLPVTWVIDPDLLAEVDAMTKSYRVTGPGGDVTKTTPGTGSAYAKAWLNELRDAVSGDQVVALPFGDTDLASIAHRTSGMHGLTSRLTGDLKTAGQLGVSTVETVLGTSTVKNMQYGKITTGVAWPVDGAVDPSILSVARAGGDTQIITRSDSFPDNTLSYTPSAARSLDDGTTAVVADASLSTEFSGDMTGTQNPALAVQDFVAQTLLITTQQHTPQRTLLVAPQRMPTVAQAKAMATAIGAVDSSPWTTTVPFATAAATRPDPDAGHKVASATSYPSSLRKQEIQQPDLRETDQQQRGLNDFAIILTRKDRVTVPFGNALLRALSTEWRGKQGAGRDFRNSTGTYLQSLINAVKILDKTTLTLSGRSGTIPVTVKNDLGQPITGLVLRLTSSQNIRLEIRNPEQPISIEAGRTRTLKFQTKASANGPTQLTAALYTKDGQVYGGSGGSVSFRVNITKVTDLVMLVIAAGLLLLVLAGVRIYRQRKRRAAAGDGEDSASDGLDADGPGGADGGNDGDDGTGDGTASGHPGDPATDTGLETPEPSPAGEKVDG